MYKDYLRQFIASRPVSHGLLRAIECRKLSNYEFVHPILDLGCGDGFFAKILLNNNMVDVGIDISPKEVAKAEKCGVYKEVRVASALKIPFPDNYFSTVLSNSVLEHIPQIDLALLEIARVLKKGGRLIFIVPRSISFRFFLYSWLLKKLGLLSLANYFLLKRHKVFGEYHCYDHGVWIEKLKRAGLNLEEYRYFHPREVVFISDFFLPFSILSLLNEKLFKKKTILPSKLRVIIFEKMLKKYYLLEREEGNTLLIVATKDECAFG